MSLIARAQMLALQQSAVMEEDLQFISAILGKGPPEALSAASLAGFLGAEGQEAFAKLKALQEMAYGALSSLISRLTGSPGACP